MTWQVLMATCSIGVALAGTPVPTIGLIALAATPAPTTSLTCVIGKCDAIPTCNTIAPRSSIPRYGTILGMMVSKVPAPLDPPLEILLRGFMVWGE